MENLPGFDPSTMNYLATQMAQPNTGGVVDPFQDMMLNLEQPDQHSTYAYAGSEDFSLQALPPPPQLKRFPSTYEDPFSDVVSAFDNPVSHDQFDPETPSIGRDNKLLGFSPPSFDYTLLDYTYRRTTISLSAQLHGMFFLAESPWASSGEAQSAPAELTCYRRNLFQITGEITLPRTLRYILTEQQEQIPIISQELVISSMESTERNAVKIISVPWKTPANPTIPAVDDKVEREPPSIPLDLTNVQDLDSDFASFPFQWKRLQFRIATANNGRRKELQQHFVVRLKVVAGLATGGKISICEVQSGPIIVRGRSPRNFQARKDLPLSHGGGHSRKATNLPAQPSRVASAESTETPKRATPAHAHAPTSVPVKSEAQTVQMPTQTFFESQDNQITGDYYDWRGSVPQLQQGAMAAALPPTSSPFQRDGIMYASSSPDLPRASQRPQPTTPAAPITLSLLEDESPHGRKSETPPEQRPAKKLQIPPRPSSFSINSLNSPDESADLLYEYFPLGLDDWMPPVDAVYRPHVVHHTKLPTDPRDPKASAKSAKSKRYFSEDVS